MSAPACKRRLVSGHHRAAHALVLGVPNDGHPRVAALRLDEIARVLRAGVVDHEDAGDLGADSRDDIEHLPADPIARNHHRDRGGRIRHRQRTAMITPITMTALPSIVFVEIGSPRKIRARTGTIRKASENSA